MRHTEPTEEQLAAWRVWVAERPDTVRRVAERLDPWTLYRLKTTNQRVTIVGFDEDGTVIVGVTGEFNLLSHERSVFGIDPDDMEECDLPGDDEQLGCFDLNVEECKELLVMDPLTRQMRMLAYALERPLRTYPRTWRKQ